MQQFRVAQKVFITNDLGELLVVQFSQKEPHELRGKWDFPGGGLEYGEDLREGLLREIREELGTTVKIQVGKPIVIWDFMTIEENKHCVAIGYDAKWQDGEITLSAEHDEYLWIDPSKLGSLDWPEQHNSGVKQFLELRSSI